MSAVQAWDLAIEQDKKSSKKESAKGDFGDHERRLVAACDRFMGFLPPGVEATKLKLKAALVLLDHGRAEDAAARLDAVVSEPGDSKLRRVAAMHLLNALVRSERFSDVGQLSVKIIGDKSLMKDAGFSLSVRELVDGAAFKTVQAGEQNEAPAVAAKRYLAFAKTTSQATFAETALHNAVVLADKAGDDALTIAAAERLLQAYPKTKTAETAAFLLASAYARSGDRNKALQAFTRYRTRFPHGARAEDADFNIAFFADALGKDRIAIQAFERYINTYPRAKDRFAAYLKVGAIYERLRDRRGEVAHYLSFDTKFKGQASALQGFFVTHKLCRAYAALKSDAAASTWQTLWTRYRGLAAAEKSDEAVMSAAAEARFELAAQVYDRYFALRLVGGAKLADAVNKKVRLLVEVEKEYAEVLALKNGEFGIAALTRIGHVYEDFARSLRAVPLPRGLDVAQKEIYRSAIENKAFPIEEKAIEAYTNALAKASELKIQSTWTVDAHVRLSQLKSDSRKVTVVAK